MNCTVCSKAGGRGQNVARGHARPRIFGRARAQASAKSFVPALRFLSVLTGYLTVSTGYLTVLTSYLTVLTKAGEREQNFARGCKKIADGHARRKRLRPAHQCGRAGAGQNF